MGRRNSPYRGQRKPYEQCSTKWCVCGGHNYTNAKRNRHHNATKLRLSYRLNSRFIRKQKNMCHDVTDDNTTMEEKDAG